METDKTKTKIDEKLLNVNVASAVKENDIGDIEVTPLNNEWEDNDGYKYFMNYYDAMNGDDGVVKEYEGYMTEALTKLYELQIDKPSYEIVTDPDA